MKSIWNVSLFLATYLFGQVIMIDPNVLKDHQRLYQKDAIEVITYPYLEVPILPELYFDIFNISNTIRLKDALK